MADDFGLDLGFGSGGLGFPRKRRRKIDEFSPEEEESLLSTIGNTALGGVAMAGNLLDLPGSSVRDLIAGENPFDQYLTPLSPENRTTGRDLLRQSGMAGSDDTYGNWWGGLAAEIALDPTTYLGIGALSKGGQAFRAAGVLDDAAKVGMKAGKRIGPRLGRMTTSFKEGFDLLDDAGRAAVEEYAKKNSLDLASVADEPIQSLGRVSLPFTDIGFNFGSGRLSQGIAGGLDWAGDILKQTAPVRMGRALFDPSVNGKLGYAEQQIAEAAYKAKWKSERAAKQAHVNLLSQMDEGFKAFNETMGPEIAARNQAAWDGFKAKLGSAGNLSPEQAEVVSQAWKGYFEGYLKMDPGEAVQKLIADIQPGGALDPKALKQGIGEVPAGWTDEMSDEFDLLEQRIENGGASREDRNRLDFLREFYQGERFESDLLWKEDGADLIGQSMSGRNVGAIRETAHGFYVVDSEVLPPKQYKTIEDAKLALRSASSGPEIQVTDYLQGNGPDRAFFAGELGYDKDYIDGIATKGQADRIAESMASRRRISDRPRKEAQAANLLAQLSGTSGMAEGYYALDGSWIQMNAMDLLAKAESELAELGYSIPKQVLNDVRAGLTNFEDALGMAQRSDDEWRGILTSRGLPSKAIEQVMRSAFGSVGRVEFEAFDEATRKLLDVNLNLHPGMIKEVSEEVMRLKNEATAIGLRELDAELHALAKKVDDAVNGIDSHDKLTQGLAAKVEATRLKLASDAIKKVPGISDSGMLRTLREQGEVLSLEDAATLLKRAKMAAKEVTDPNLSRVQEVLQRIPKVSPAGLAKQLGDVTEAQAEELLKAAKKDTLFQRSGDSMADMVSKAIKSEDTSFASKQVLGDISNFLDAADRGLPLPELTATDDEIAAVFDELFKRQSDGKDTLFQHADDELLGRTKEVLTRIPKISPAGLAKQLGTITEEQAADLLSRARLKVSNQFDLMQKLQRGEITAAEFIMQQREAHRLYQQAAGATKGAVTFQKDGKALIQFFGAADVSTHLHEASHVMRRHLTAADNEIANQFVGAAPGKKWTVDQEEKWARGFENFMTTGKAPSKRIKAVFERLKEWMVGIYSSIKGSAVDVKLTPQIKELYGRLIGSTPGPRKVGNSIAYETYDKLVRLGGELGGDVDTAWRLLSNGAADLPDSVKAQVKDIGENLKKINADIHSSIESKGGKASWIADREEEAGIAGFAYVPRYVDMKGPKDLAELRAGKVLKTTHSGMQKRSAAIRAVPAEIVNKMLTDDALRGDDAVDEIAAKFGEYLDEGFEVDGKVVGRDGHAEAMAQFVKEHKAAPLFTNGTATDFLKYQTGAQAVSRNLDAMHEIVSRTMGEGEGVTIAKAFQNAGLNVDQAVAHWAGKNNLVPEDALTMTVPMDVANALVTTNKISDSPEWAKAIGTTIDDIHNWWKGSMTVLFPSFHSRNLSSGQYMNMVASGEIQTLADIASYTAESYRIARQIGAGTLPKELLEELYVNGVITKHANRDAIGSAASSSDLMSAPPGWNAFRPVDSDNALSIFSTAKQAVKDTPRYIDAVPGAVMTRNLQGAALETGARVAENVEFMNRVPMYLYLKKKGWSAEAAAQKVNDLQVDYGAMAPFEKNVMKRLLPFYSFNRRIAPVILGTILERPGGGLAQTIKASADLSNADPLTPEHVASTLSIPNPLKGEDADFAGKSYLTGFGLPHEQLGQFFGGPQTILREGASQLSPLVKAPLEWATGQSFFQAGPGGKGRDLEDLDPTIGRTIGNLMGTDKVSTPTALEHFVANSPLSRVAGTARQLTDSRKNVVEKGVNLLTGVKVSDVSESNQERVIQQRALDLMDEMGARTFAKPYFPSEIEEAMTPEEQKQAEALELLQAVLADRQKRRKAKKGK